MSEQARLRRLRRTASLRRLVRETELRPDHLIYPIFVLPGGEAAEPIPSMPGQSRLPLSEVAKVGKAVEAAGIPAVLLFGLPAAKDETGSEASSEKGAVQEAVRLLQEHCTDLSVITDVCLCSYTTHGHCGVLDGEAVDNDATLPLLAAVAVSHARAGADVVAPSAMMDGQVKAIRTALDEAGFAEVAILSYAAKFNSGFYGPFRDAADSAPETGDRAAYQMDPANSRMAMAEIAQDLYEGADIVMIKPALSYLDVIARARERFDAPIVAYNVSGEFAMVKAAAQRGWIDEQRVVLELLTSMVRAGADMIITYSARDVATWLEERLR